MTALLKQLSSEQPGVIMEVISFAFLEQKYVMMTRRTTTELLPRVVE